MEKIMKTLLASALLGLVTSGVVLLIADNKKKNKEKKIREKEITEFERLGIKHDLHR